MSDEHTTDAPQPAAAQPDTGTSEPDWQAEAEKYKALARKHEERSKANAAAAARLAEVEDASKTEAQRMHDRLAALERETADARATALRHEVASAKGVPAELLHGATEDELHAAADALLAFRGQQPSSQPARLDLGQGSRPAPGSDPNAWLRQRVIARRGR
jgi:hypothetical protein